MQRALMACASLLLAACGTTNTPDAAAPDLTVASSPDLTVGPSPDLSVAPSPDMTPPTVYTVFVRGKLKNDVATSKGIHDQIVASGKATALSLGDMAHYTFLNIAAPGDGGAAPSDSLLAIDEWTSLSGLMKFTTDPNVMAGFAQLFAAPPDVTVTIHPMGWTEWGKLDPTGQGAPLYMFSVRAPLSAATLDQSRTAHNMVVAGAQMQAMQAGDVGHMVFIPAQDMKQFQSVDFWTSLQGAMAVYSDPNFQAGLATLFSAPPTVEPYVHSDWAQY